MPPAPPALPASARRTHARQHTSRSPARAVPFWREPGGLDLAYAALRPGGLEAEVRFRFGQAYRLDLRRVGLEPPALLAALGPDPRALMVCLGGGTFVALPVERVLAACDPAFRRAQAARGARSSTIGARIRALRLASGRTAAAVATAAGMARSNYARLESASHEPRFDTLRRVARALDVPVEALVEDTTAPAA
jgi:DNA-binding XRE family transcriptional regulator